LAPDDGGEGKIEVPFSRDAGGEENVEVPFTPTPGRGECRSPPLPQGRGVGVRGADNQAASEEKSAHLPTADIPTGGEQGNETNNKPGPGPAYVGYDGHLCPRPGDPGGHARPQPAPAAHNRFQPAAHNHFQPAAAPRSGGGVFFSLPVRCRLLPARHPGPAL